MSSTLIKYFTKAFTNHGVDAQLNELPIVFPSAEEAKVIEAKASEIVMLQKLNTSFDYRQKLAELDVIVFDLYKLDPEEREEIKTWYQRHYPKLFNPAAAEI